MSDCGNWRPSRRCKHRMPGNGQRRRRKFFNRLKSERSRLRTFKTRDDAKSDVFDYIEFFYNPKRKHAGKGMPSPVEFKRQQKRSRQGVWETRAIQ